MAVEYLPQHASRTVPRLLGEGLLDRAPSGPGVAAAPRRPREQEQGLGPVRGQRVLGEAAPESEPPDVRVGLHHQPAVVPHGAVDERDYEGRRPRPGDPGAAEQVPGVEEALTGLPSPAGDPAMAGDVGDEALLCPAQLPPQPGDGAGRGPRSRHLPVAPDSSGLPLPGNRRGRPASGFAKAGRGTEVGPPASLRDVQRVEDRHSPALQGPLEGRRHGPSRHGVADRGALPADDQHRLRRGTGQLLGDVAPARHVDGPCRAQAHAQHQTRTAGMERHQDEEAPRASVEHSRQQKQQVGRAGDQREGFVSGDERRRPGHGARLADRRHSRQAAAEDCGRRSLLWTVT
jgi:hypothetical protein